MKNPEFIQKTAVFATPVLWVWAFYPTLHWILNSYAMHNNIFGIYAAGILLFIFFYKYKKNEFSLKNSIDVKIKTFPLIIVAVSISAYFFSKYFIKIHILNSIIFGIGTYGLLGFYINYNLWKKLFIPFILIIQTLPFGSNLDTYIGFPLRIFTTHAVENLFSAIGIENIRNQTIFVIENRAANIDISCSGMKGIWAAVILFLLIFYLENKKFSYRTALIFIAMISLLISFNILRVSIIVFLDTVQNMPKAASMLHVPLGITGFVFSVLISILLLKYFNPGNTETERKTESLKIKKILLAHAIIIISLVVLISIKPNNTNDVYITATNNIEIVSDIKLSASKLSLNEKSLLISGKNDSSKKYIFDNPKLKGSIIISETENWRGHHKPEICYTAEGLLIEKTETILAEQNFFIKEISFKQRNFKAYYWFQSEEKTTDDFPTRVWSALFSKSKKWIMVSAIVYNDSDKITRNNFFNEIKNQLSKNI